MPLPLPPCQVACYLPQASLQASCCGPDFLPRSWHPMYNQGYPLHLIFFFFNVIMPATFLRSHCTYHKFAATIYVPNWDTPVVFSYTSIIIYMTCPKSHIAYTDKLHAIIVLTGGPPATEGSSWSWASTFFGTAPPAMICTSTDCAPMDKDTLVAIRAARWSSVK